MSNLDAQLVQYQVLGERRLYFERMFWQSTAFMISILLVLVVSVNNVDLSIIQWLILGAGVSTMQMSVVIWRLRVTEAHYQNLMHQIEVGLIEAGNAKVLISKRRSGFISARTMTVASLAILGLLITIFGIYAVMLSMGIPMPG
jgi:uncharacterized membrane protein